MEQLDRNLISLSVDVFPKFDVKNLFTQCMDVFYLRMIGQWPLRIASGTTTIQPSKNLVSLTGQRDEQLQELSTTNASDSGTVTSMFCTTSHTSVLE